jgi:hypothetical protein
LHGNRGNKEKKKKKGGEKDSKLRKVEKTTQNGGFFDATTLMGAFILYSVER